MMPKSESMLLLGQPMSELPSGGFYWAPKGRSSVQVVIYPNDNDRRPGWLAHIWLYSGGGNGKSIEIFTKKRPANSESQALEMTNHVLELIRDALTEPTLANASDSATGESGGGQ